MQRRLTLQISHSVPVDEIYFMVVSDAFLLIVLRQWHLSRWSYLEYQTTLQLDLIWNYNAL